MPMIKVRALPDRKAFTAARGGKLIPTDQFVAVEHTPWIDRLINFHGDIEVEKEKAAKSLGDNTKKD